MFELITKDEFYLLETKYKPIQNLACTIFPKSPILASIILKLGYFTEENVNKKKIIIKKF